MGLPRIYSYMHCTCSCFYAPFSLLSSPLSVLYDVLLYLDEGNTCSLFEPAYVYIWSYTLNCASHAQAHKDFFTKPIINHSITSNEVGSRTGRRLILPQLLHHDCDFRGIKCGSNGNVCSCGVAAIDMDVVPLTQLCP